MNISRIVSQHFQELSQKYSGLHLIQQRDGSWSVVGQLCFSARYQDQQIDDEYEIEIHISPGYPSDHPSVRETGNRIPRDFHHSGENLCLGEPGEVILKFREEPNLLGFTERCLIPYLYNFSYNTRYGLLPFGELPHGWLGILEHYQGVFQIKGHKALLGLMSVCVENRFNGHEKCPCGSKRRLRRCHGEIVRKLITEVPNTILKREYAILIEGLAGFTKSQ